MLNGKHISFKEIIEQVYADNGYQYDLPVTDMITWIADCLNFIGHPDQYEVKIKGHKDYPPFDITNYRAALPCDFHKLRQIAVDGFAAYPSEHSFHHLLDGSCCGLSEIDETLGDTFADNFNNQFNTALGTRYATEPFTYTLNNDFITLSRKKGKVCMSYWAIMTDKEGFPMIPEDVSYKEAVKRYLTYKLDYIGWRRGDIPDKVYQDSKQEYEWYIGQASSNAKMPDENKMENLKLQMLRLRPNVTHFSGFYRYLGYGEQRKLR